MIPEQELVLDTFVPDDAAVLCEVDRDPEHRRRFEFPEDFTPSLEHSKKVIARWDEERRAGTRFTFAIRERVTKQLLGGCELLPRGDGSANLSYWTLPSHRRRRVASHGVGLVRALALREFGLRCLEVVVDPDNIGSQKVARRNGFREAGMREGRLLYVSNTESDE